MFHKPYSGNTSIEANWLREELLSDVNVKTAQCRDQATRYLFFLYTTHVRLVATVSDLEVTGLALKRFADHRPTTGPALIRGLIFHDRGTHCFRSGDLKFNVRLAAPSGNIPKIHTRYGIRARDELSFLAFDQSSTWAPTCIPIHFSMFHLPTALLRQHLTIKGRWRQTRDLSSSEMTAGFLRYAD